MDQDEELAVIRRAYAQQVMFAADSNDSRVEAAFADIRREDFLGPGPWQLVGDRGYQSTPDARLVHIYADTVVGILPERMLNNGQPSLHAKLMASAAPKAGEHVVHIGAGTGYYTAILAHLVGAFGKVAAIEFDARLAERAARNLRHYTNVRVINGDGSTAEFDPADLIYVNAGATRPADLWLDRLRDGGRLIIPLTTDKGFNPQEPGELQRRGAVFRIERKGTEYLARWISAVEIFPCQGVRDAASEAALASALAKGGWEAVTGLHRREDVLEDRCWLRAPGWCLTYH